GCIKGQCLEFDGSDDFITIPNSTTVSDTFNDSSWLVSAWFKPNIGGSGGNGSEILQRYSPKGFLLRVTGTTDPYFLVYISDGTTPHSFGGGYLNIYKWNYIVAQRDNSSMSIYIDGIFKNSLAVPSSYDISSSNPIYIGEACCSAYNLNGMLDEISIYNSPKQSFEIQQDYYSGINRLFKKNDIALNEFNQRITELKTNLANNE
ncbi:MAG: LamG domain-containing protein, partial [Candidatus Pacebacteria bacterium]|nr:LamG domain-containing protein [Candidatus Paceibacterota bacterium]